MKYYTCTWPGCPYREPFKDRVDAHITEPHTPCPQCPDRQFTVKGMSRHLAQGHGRQTSTKDYRLHIELPCGCFTGLNVQQANPCQHNSGTYPHHELDLEQVPCGCKPDWFCDRCNGHGYVWKKRFRF